MDRRGWSTDPRTTLRLLFAVVLVLLVYMAFRFILLQVSILGLAGEVPIVLHAQIVYGHLIGTRLPVASTARATVLGIGVLLLALELLGAVPYLGDLVQFVLLVVGFGAVVNTYFGLGRFEPAEIPGGEG